MIKINLLPEGLKRQRQFNAYFFGLIGIAAGLLLIMVIIFSVFSVQMKFQTKKINRVSSEWEVIKKEEKEVLSLQELKKELETKRKAIENLAQSRILWSRKLYQLSRQISPCIWLTDFTLVSHSEKVKELVENKNKKRRSRGTVTWITQTVRSIRLEGMVISLAGEEMIDSIGKFMVNLKNDNEFFSDFSDIELVFTKREKVLDKEAMAFELMCRLK